jgi:FkbM family methyltransferase
MKKVLWKCLSFCAKSPLGRRLGRVWISRLTFSFITRNFSPELNYIASINNYKIRIISNKDRPLDGIGQHVLFHQTYEEQVTNIFKKLLKRGMSVIDVGAHIGYYSLLSARLVGEEGKVFSFEPELNNYNDLLNNISLNNFMNIQAVKSGVGDKNEFSNLFISKTWSGKHSLTRISSDIKDSVRVPVITLDSYINSQKIDLIKTDTEGNDLKVLLGAKNTTKNCSFYVTEFWEQGLIKSGYSAEQYWNLINEYKFKYIYLLNEHKKCAELTNLNTVLDYFRKYRISVNLLCTKEKINLSQ